MVCKEKRDFQGSLRILKYCCNHSFCEEPEVVFVVIQQPVFFHAAQFRRHGAALHCQIIRQLLSVKGDGKNSAAGAKVTLSGGTKFYLSAPLTQTEDVEGSWTATMQGSITKDYSAYKLTTNDSVQDLAFVFGEGVEQEQYVEFSRNLSYRI